jgi:hypothetical protein
VVKKEPTYIPAMCLEERRETMEADYRGEIWMWRLPSEKE